MNYSYAQLTLRQLSESLSRFPRGDVAARPRNGWIASMRSALDMTAAQLAARLGISQSNVARLEKRERDDGITLGTLRKAADAIGCDLVYAIVPRAATLDALIEQRARDVATSEMSRIAHTMELEGQGVPPAEREAQVAARVAQLIAEPRRLWDVAIESAPSDGAVDRGTE